MIPRTIGRPMLRLQSSSLASSSRLPVRHLSSALVKPSVVALGKRPIGSSVATATSVRHLSWIPWTQSAPTPTPSPAAEAAAVEQAVGATPVAAIPSDALSSTSSAGPAAGSEAAAVEQAIGATPVAETASTSTSAAVDVSASTADLASTPTIHSLSDATLGDLVRMNPDTPLDTLLHSQEAINAFAAVGDLPLIGLTHRWFSLPGWTVDALMSLHNLTGLPWWATIAATTFMIRLLVFRLVIEGQKHNVRLQAVSPQMTELTSRIKQATVEKDQVGIQLAQGALQGLFKKHDVHPLRAIKVPLVQFPVFLSMFYGLRRLAEAPLPQFLEGGFSWVTDLTATDPYLILPLLSVVLTNVVIRIGADGTGSPAAKASSFGYHMKNLLTVLSVPSFLFIMQMPAAVLFYWTTTNVFTLAQAYLLSKPAFKRLVNIPPPPVVPDAPNGEKPDPTYRETWEWVSGNVKNSYAEAREKAAAREAELERKAKQAGKRPGTGAMAGEVIREKRK